MATAARTGRRWSRRYAPVAGHAGIDVNEAADQLAAEAATETQQDVPIDLASVRGAIRRQAMSMVHKRAAASHPHL